MGDRRAGGVSGYGGLLGILSGGVGVSVGDRTGLVSGSDGEGEEME